ncbi:TetR/AcrR family transcriptional regulator [Subtercola boreus]|uniref:TetR/AcrR family transcriptional regulator n=1 Tax=Subtercola boreus TaxID=120213 RepID=UPI001C0F281B|nr:helix-turn-helix domain-containing protein [Subtercola boreus]
MSTAISTAAGAPSAPASDGGPEELPDVGLRERKRRATSRSIQRAVLELSRDKGLDNVTVDEISRRADVSPRTFFNYFSSKESAVLGESPFSLKSADVQTFIAAGPGQPIFDGLLVIMRSMAETDDHDLEMHQLRKMVVRDYPHLLVQRITSMHEFELELTGAIEERLVTDARQGASGTEIPDQAVISERARLIAMVSIATMRHAWARWAAAAETQSMSTLLTHSFRELQTLL